MSVLEANRSMRDRLRVYIRLVPKCYVQRGAPDEVCNAPGGGVPRNKLCCLHLRACPNLEKTPSLASI